MEVVDWVNSIREGEGGRGGGGESEAVEGKAISIAVRSLPLA